MTDASRFHRRAAAFGLAAALMSSFGLSFFIGMFGTPLTALTGAVAIYAVITPWLVARWIRPVAPATGTAL